MRPILAAAVALAMIAGARADDCESLVQPELDAAGFYVDNDLCQPGCIASVEVYQESNGISGLQKYGCPGLPPDTLILRIL